MNSSDNILTLPPPKPGVRLSYGSDPNQFLDLRRPSRGAAHELVIMIHGGYWRALYDLTYAGHLCVALTAKGIATANVEYRRVGNLGGGWPGTFDDVRSAYRFLAQKAHRYGLESKRITVIGHSAGAQLALCLAAREPEIKSAVSLAGVIDLQRAYKLHLSNDAVVEFLGGTPGEVKDHYREADPMQQTIEAHQWIVHGLLDDVVPPSFSRDYVLAKRKANEDAQLLEISGAGHFEVVDPRSGAWNDIEKTILKAAI